MDPDQLAIEKPADLDLHCFQNRIYPGSVSVVGVENDINLRVYFYLLSHGFEGLRVK